MHVMTYASMIVRSDISLHQQLDRLVIVDAARLWPVIPDSKSTWLVEVLRSDQDIHRDESGRKGSLHLDIMGDKIKPVGICGKAVRQVIKFRHPFCEDFTPSYLFN